MIEYIQGVFFMMNFILTAINLILFILIVKFFLVVIREKGKIMQTALDVEQTRRKIGDIVKSTVENFMEALEQGEETGDGIEETGGDVQKE